MQGARAQAELPVNTGPAADTLMTLGRPLLWISVLIGKVGNSDTISGAFDEILPVSRFAKPAIKGPREFSKEGYLLGFNPKFSKLFCPSHIFPLNP